jgi:hypothetical protein
MDINKILKNKYKKNYDNFLEKFELENGIKYSSFYRFKNIDKFKQKDKLYYIKNSKKIIARALKYYYSHKKIKKVLTR